MDNMDFLSLLSPSAEISSDVQITTQKSQRDPGVVRGERERGDYLFFLPSPPLSLSLALAHFLCQTQTYAFVDFKDQASLDAALAKGSVS